MTPEGVIAGQKARPTARARYDETLPEKASRTRVYCSICGPGLCPMNDTCRGHQPGISPASNLVEAGGLLGRPVLAAPSPERMRSGYAGGPKLAACLGVW